MKNNNNNNDDDDVGIREGRGYLGEAVGGCRCVIKLLRSVVGALSGPPWFPCLVGTALHKAATLPCLHGE